MGASESVRTVSQRQNSSLFVHEQRQPLFSWLMLVVFVVVNKTIRVRFARWKASQMVVVVEVVGWGQPKPPPNGARVV